MLMLFRKSKKKIGNIFDWKKGVDDDNREVNYDNDNDDEDDDDDDDDDDEDGYGGCHLRQRYCKGATGAKGVRPAVQAAVIMSL